MQLMMKNEVNEKMVKKRCKNWIECEVYQKLDPPTLENYCQSCKKGVDIE